MIDLKAKNWTKEELEILADGYRKELPISEIAKNLPGRTVNSITEKAHNVGITECVIRKNNPNYTREYQDYDWCFYRYVTLGKTYEEMAKEANCSLRVIQKWCSDIHHINNKTFKILKKLSQKQKDIIIGGILGDGHITPSETQPLYIESHSEHEKDYIFWKYNILKDVCLKEPKYYPSTTKIFTDGKAYDAAAYYRIHTRCLYDLKSLRDKPIVDIIKDINELQLSCHMLDDGSRSECQWEICLASFSQEEIDCYISICKEKFGLNLKQRIDKRYCAFDSHSSRMLDNIIINNVPCDLDIIKKKIARNKFFLHDEQMDFLDFVDQNSFDLHESIIAYNTIKDAYGSITLEDFWDRMKNNE